jgi:predicted MFS family arabinose efflux permease
MDELRNNGPFRALIVAQAIRALAFWLVFTSIMATASFTLNASSTAMTAIIAGFSLPHVLLAPFSGLIVDRSNPKLILAATFAAGAAVAQMLAHVTHVWQVVALAIFWSATGTLIIPSISSLLKTLVAEDGLRRANGINQACFEVTLIGGPALAGFLSDRFGRGLPMGIAAGLYFVAALAVTAVRTPPRSTEIAPAGRLLNELREGVLHIARVPDLRVLVGWGAIGWGAFAALLALEPIFVRQYLGGGAGRLGLIYSLGGIGSTAGAIGIVAIRRLARRELFAAAVGFFVVAVSFCVYVGLASWPEIIPALIGLGIGFGVYGTLSQTLIQRRSPLAVVGRVTSAKRGIEEGAAMVVSLVAGGVARAAGVRATLLGAGILMACAALAMGRAAFRQSAATEDEPVAAPFVDLPAVSDPPLPAVAAGD